MADRFGGKWLIGGSIFLSSVAALLTPTAARIHIVLLIILRVLSGLGEGVISPAMHAMIARWSAPKYRSVVVSVIYAGGNVGIVTGLLLTGVLCDYGFAGGWPSAFYVFGLFGCVWSVAWFLLCYNSPSDHPRISAVERKYWETVIGATDLVAHQPTPWREILTSVPVWALAVAYFAHIWGTHSLMNFLPLFMHDVLGFNSSKGGIFSAVPYLASSYMLPVSGLSADWLRAPGRLSTNSVRKIFCVAGFSLSGCFLISVTYMGCNRALAIATVSAAVVTLYPAFSTVLVNQLDLAPLHAGKIMGLTYTIANLGSVFGTHAVSELTYGNSTRSAWQNVFFLTAAVYAVGAVVFVIFGSGYRQRWAGDTSHHEVIVTLDRDKENFSDKKLTDVAEQNVK